MGRSPLFRLTAFLCLLGAIVPGVSFASAPGALEPSAAFDLSISQGAEDTLVLNWKVAEGYYLYRSRFAAKTQVGRSLPLNLPDGEPYDDPNFGDEQIFREDVSIAIAPVVQPLTLTWQGCQQDGICYAPQTATLTAQGTLEWPQPPIAKDRLGFLQAQATPETVARSAPVSTGITVSEETGLIESLASRGGSAFAILAFFGFGLLLAFTPCVLPMLPILTGMLAGQGAPIRARRGLVLTGTYVLAMASAFGLLGVVAAWSGANLQVALQSPAAIGLVSALFCLLALSMFGAFELQMPAALQARLGRARRRDGSVGAAAVLGLTSALIIGPCVTAPLAGALLYIAQTGDVALGATALFALGLGQGMPLLAVGMFGPRILPRSGAWMKVTKRVFGVVFLGFAIWLAGRVLPGQIILTLWAALLIGTGVAVWTAACMPAMLYRSATFTLSILLVVTGILEGVGAALGGSDPTRPLAPLRVAADVVTRSSEVNFSTVTSAAELKRTLSEDGKRPALVYVTAEWCVTCRVIERGPLSDPGVIAELVEMNSVKFDVTEMTPSARDTLRELAVAGPPTMLFLDASRTEVASSRLVGDIDSAELLRSLRIVGQ
ncbi:protein-disulfide reductase DsbD [Salipiger mangrovisoli]|uniref:Protein-disulfide reductase DsbD n=1 Tax=Salipiger mangrovisoli TaxID=2865933 RepID=A0ABR9X6L9_9RHOB|nr:protein-disulfide reductase DsbD [Salipiger mangrovisoli]MBE9639250.1 protein-disulfide reductase DsbD [Salipiger mangrovisoli]